MLNRKISSNYYFYAERNIFFFFYKTSKLNKEVYNIKSLPFQEEIICQALGDQGRGRGGGSDWSETGDFYITSFCLMPMAGFELSLL
jgi:hypothetical protein